jgi:dTDP-glucose 4,6-dehydratase
LQSEEPSLEPTTIYGESKLVAERLLRQAPCEAKIARCFAFLGPHLPLDTHFAAGNFLCDALASRDIHIASDGRAVRSYFYPTDLAIWLWTMLFRAPPLRPYNVGSDHAVSILELAEAIRAEVSPAIEINIDRPAGNEPAVRYVPAISRARTELGLRQTVYLEEAIRRTAAWHRLK